MPLFIVDEKIENLDIDAFTLPYFSGIKKYYQNNYIGPFSLYEIYKESYCKEIISEDPGNPFSSISLEEYFKPNFYEEKINSLIVQEKKLKTKIEENKKTRETLDIKFKDLLNPLSFREASLVSFLINKRDDFFKNVFHLLQSELHNLSKEEIQKKAKFYEEYENKRNKFDELDEKLDKELEIIKNQIFKLNKFKNKSVITLNNIKINKISSNSYKKNNNRIEVSVYYRKLIEYALANNFYKIAIPIIDFYNMPDRNYYIDIARNFIREEINSSNEDITVYLILTDSNNDYCQDSEPENIYEKIYSLLDSNADKKEIEKRAKREFEHFSKYLTSELKAISKKEDYLEFYYNRLLEYKKNNNFQYDLDDFYSNKRVEETVKVEKLKYWDENVFWEKISRYKNTEFCLDFDEIKKDQENNKKILKKIGEDLKYRIKKEEEKEELRKERDKGLLCEICPSRSEDLQDEIQSLLASKEESFSQMVLRIIQRSRRDNVSCYKAANVNKNIFSKILKDAKGDENEDGSPYVYKPDKKIVFAFAIALRLKKAEAEELLQKAGYAFTHYPQDIIVRTFIEKGIYDIDLVNQFLFRFNQPLLGTTSREN